MKKPPRQTLLVNVNGVSRLMGNAGGMERGSTRNGRIERLSTGVFDRHFHRRRYTTLSLSLSIYTCNGRMIGSDVHGNDV